MLEMDRYSKMLLLINRWLAQLTRIASGDLSDDHEVVRSLRENHVFGLQSSVSFMKTMI